MTMSLVLIGLGVTLAALLWYSHAKDQAKYGHIPGPSKLPVLGNMHQLQRRDSEGKDIPLSVILTDMGRKYGGVMWINLGFTNMVILNSYEAIYEALVKKGADFADRLSSYRVIASQDHIGIVQMDFSARHRALKSIVQQAVKVYGDGAQTMEGIINESLQDLVEDLIQEEANAIPVKDRLRAAFGNTIYILVFGRQIDRSKTTYASLSELEENILAVWEASASGLLIDKFPITRHMFRATYRKAMLYKAMRDDFWTEQIQYHKDGWDGEEERCLLDVLLKEQRTRQRLSTEEEFSDEFIRVSLSQLFNAGILTSTTLLTGVILMCLHNLKLQDQLYAEVCSVVGETGKVSVSHINQLHYTRALIFEALRYFSINPLSLFHKTTVDTSVVGFAVPRDTTVAMNLWALHHDPDFWTEPWSFSPERYLEADGTVVAPDHPNRKRLLPFGAGHRVCAAEHFALNRLCLFLSTLVQRFHFEPETPEARLPSHDPRTWPFFITILVPYFKAHFVPRA